MCRSRGAKSVSCSLHYGFGDGKSLWLPSIRHVRHIYADVCVCVCERGRNNNIIIIIKALVLCEWVITDDQRWWRKPATHSESAERHHQRPVRNGRLQLSSDQCVENVSCCVCDDKTVLLGSHSLYGHKHGLSRTQTIANAIEKLATA